MPNTDNLNRTIFISDNLPFLQSLDTESVDLVVIDPPFGKRQTFTGTLKPPLSELERQQERARMVEWGVYDVASAYELGVEYPDQSGNTVLFKDIWRFERVVGEDWWEKIQDTPVWWLIESTRRTHGEDTAAYIAFMAQRMIEVRRILRPTGSAYLHCDHEANAYLRQMMDSVFGARNFRNEIVWKRTARGYKGSQFTARAYNANTDTILFYAKSPSAFFDMSRVMEPYDPDYFEKAYRLSDDVGRYYLDTAYNRPSANPRPNLCYEYNGFFPPHPSGWKVGRARMEELERAGDLVVKDGRLYRKIRPGPGRIRNGLWDDIAEARGSERTGYPTQKPQALARRMIEASSNPGDIVLDCFAGRAYVPVAAEETGRRWIACDMSPRALTMVLRQFAKKPELGMTVEGEEGDYDDANPRFEGRGVLRVRGPNQLPNRSEGDADAEPPRMRVGLAERGGDELSELRIPAYARRSPRNQIPPKTARKRRTDMARVRGRVGDGLLALRPPAARRQAVSPTRPRRAEQRRRLQRRLLKSCPSLHRLQQRQERPPNPGGYDGQGARGGAHPDPSEARRNQRGVRRPPRMGAPAVRVARERVMSTYPNARAP